MQVQKICVNEKASVRGENVADTLHATDFERDLLNFTCLYRKLVIFLTYQYCLHRTQYFRSYSGDCKSMLNCIKSLHSILLLPEKTDSNNITCFYWQTKRIKIRLYL